MLLAKTTLRWAQVAAGLLTLTSGALAQDAGQQASGNKPKDSAHIVSEYTTYSSSGFTVQGKEIEVPVIWVTVEQGFRFSDVASGKGITVVDLGQNGRPIPLGIAKSVGYSINNDKGEKVQFAFVLVPTDGSTLVVEEDRYMVTIHYDSVDSWPREPDGRRFKLGQVNRKEAERRTADLVDQGKTIDHFGEETAKTTGYSSPSGESFLGRLDTELNPLISESSRELALEYSIRLPYMTQHRELIGHPGYLSADLDLEGRWSSDRQDQSITDYTKASVSFESMILFTEDGRYLPAGFKFSAGYEDGDVATEGGVALQAQAVVSLPFLSRGPEWLQEALDFQRPFAPPYLAIGYVNSDAEVSGIEQSRASLEAGWVFPLAEEWDVNLQWQRSFFDEDAIGDQNLFTGDLTYYADGDLSQGVRMSFESGYRAAVGDIDSTILLGYLIKL